MKKSKKKIMIAAALLCGMLAHGALQTDCDGDAVDPRVRSYVTPVRVVWTSGAEAGGFRTRCKVNNAE